MYRPLNAIAALVMTFGLSHVALAQDSSSSSKSKVKETTTETTDPATGDRTYESTRETEKSQESEDDRKNDGGFFFEPGVTYENLGHTLKYPGPTDSKEEINGFGIALRFGGHVRDIFFLAADARFSQPTYKSDELGDNSRADSYNIAATVGLQTPVAGLRVWASYILAGDLDPKEILGTDIKLTGMNGYRVGVGFYVIAVSVNLEYQNARYNKLTVQDQGLLPSALITRSGNSDGYIASVTFPIAF